MKKFIIMAILTMFASTIALADPPAGKGPGVKGNSGISNGIKNNKSIDLPNNIASKPPGLQNKDNMPPGLAKQNKTPPGWSKGEKTGWDKDRNDRGVMKSSWDRFLDFFRD